MPGHLPGLLSMSIGAPREFRNPDLLYVKQTLLPLSYRRMLCGASREIRTPLTWFRKPGTIRWVKHICVALPEGLEPSKRG